MTFDEALNDCIERMTRGETLESCLARHPHHTRDLRPLLQVGQMLRTAPPAMSSQAWSRGRARLREAALAGGAVPARRWLPRLAWPLAAAAVLLALVWVVGAAGNSAPGELLHPLRRLGETAALGLTSDPVARAGQHLRLAEQRLAELQATWQDTSAVNPQDVSRFAGDIDAALAQLARRADGPTAQATLQGLVSIAYEGRAWLLSVAGSLPAEEQAALGQLAGQLARMEHWAQAGLLDPASLANYALGEEPPALPTLAPPATATPTSVAAPATGTPTAQPAETAAEPTRTATATPQPSSPTPTWTHTPTASQTPTVTRAATPTDTPQPPAATPTWTPSAIAPLPPPTPTEEPDETPEPDETSEPDETPEPTETPDEIDVE